MDIWHLSSFLSTSSGKWTDFNCQALFHLQMWWLYDCCPPWQTESDTHGPVVQSIVRLTSSLRGQLIKYSVLPSYECFPVPNNRVFDKIFWYWDRHLAQNILSVIIFIPLSSPVSNICIRWHVNRQFCYFQIWYFRYPNLDTCETCRKYVDITDRKDTQGSAIFMLRERCPLL